MAHTLSAPKSRRPREWCLRSIQSAKVRAFKRGDRPVQKAWCWGLQKLTLSGGTVPTPLHGLSTLPHLGDNISLDHSYSLIPHCEPSTRLRPGYRGNTTFLLTWKKNTDSLSAERPINSDQLWLSHLFACPLSRSTMNSVSITMESSLLAQVFFTVRDFGSSSYPGSLRQVDVSICFVL